MTPVKVARPPVHMAFTYRELAALREAVYYRALDVTNLRRLYDLVEDAAHDAELARKQATLDGLIQKLGIAGEGDEE